MQYRLTENRWRAIQNSDKNSDGDFVYGDKLNKIFCKPSCPYKTVNKKNIEIFNDSKEALDRGYRPCKKCEPAGKSVSNELWAKEIETILKNNYFEDLTLDIIANLAHGAPYYMHHMFKSVTGKTPLERLTEIRIQKSKSLLKRTNLKIPDIAERVGINNQSYFSTLFKKNVGLTPLKYRKQNPNNRLSELLKDISSTLEEV